MAHPLKSHSKIEENGLWAQIFPRLRRAKRGFALRSVPHSPESATLAVTIIPVTPAVGVKTRGTRARSFTSLSRSPHRLVPHITFPTSLAPPPFTTTYISTFHRLHSPHSLVHLSILFTCPLPLITSPPTQLLWVQGITRLPLRRTVRTLRLYARMATLASVRF